MDIHSYIPYTLPQFKYVLLKRASPHLCNEVVIQKDTRRSRQHRIGTAICHLGLEKGEGRLVGHGVIEELRVKVNQGHGDLVTCIIAWDVGGTHDFVDGTGDTFANLLRDRKMGFFLLLICITMRFIHFIMNMHNKINKTPYILILYNVCIFF